MVHLNWARGSLRLAGLSGRIRFESFAAPLGAHAILHLSLELSTFEDRVRSDAENQAHFQVWLAFGAPRYLTEALVKHRSAVCVPADMSGLRPRHWRRRRLAIDEQTLSKSPGQSRATQTRLIASTTRQPQQASREQEYRTCADP